MEAATDTGEEERIIEMELGEDGDVRTIVDAAVPLHPELPAAPRREVVTAQSFWNNFNIKKGIDIMVDSWKAISLATAHHAWRKALPWADLRAPLGNDMATGDRQTVEAAIEDAVEAARRVRAEGYEQVEAADIREIIEESEDLTVEDMVEEEDLDDTQREQDEEEGENMQDADPTTSKLSEILGLADKLAELVEESDGVPLRSAQASTGIKNALREYQALFTSRVNARHQALITRYLDAGNPQPPPANQPPPPPAASEDNSDEDLSDFDPSEVVEMDFEGFLEDDRAPDVNN